MNHGGKRKGAGRPKGSGKGRTVVTSSINLKPEIWAKLDRLRGENSRSAWISERIKRANVSLSGDRPDTQHKEKS